MIGFLKMPASEFAAFDAAALVKYKLFIGGSSSTTAYTYSRPDTDPAYVWARVEHDFIEGDVKTEAEAIAEGMAEVE